MKAADTDFETATYLWCYLFSYQSCLCFGFPLLFLVSDSRLHCDIFCHNIILSKPLSHFKQHFTGLLSAVSALQIVHYMKLFRGQICVGCLIGVIVFGLIFIYIGHR